MKYVCLASPNSCPEDVCVKAVVIPEFEFRNVQRQIFLADLVEASHDTTLDQRPETFNGLSVDRADDVLAARMVDHAEWIFFGEFAVSGSFVRAKQADFVRYGFANELGQRLAFQIVDDAGDHVSLALHRSDHDRFARAARSAAAIAALVLMPVLGEAADESFINLDNAGKLLNILRKSDADFVAHKPSSLIGAEAHVSLDLEGAHPLFADQHQVNDTKPVLQRLIRVLEYCSGQVREAITGRPARSALRALPMMAGGERIDLGIAATRANDAFRPAARDQIADAILLGLKERIELCCGQLVDGFRAFGAGHDGFSLSTKAILA